MKEIACLLLVLGSVYSCDRNHKPVINSMTISPSAKSAGTIFTLKAITSDEDGDALSYLWSAAEGTFLSSTSTDTVQWKSPVTGAGLSCVISLKVSDGKDEVSKDLTITLEKPEFGSVDGTVNYTSFSIPVSGAIITLGEDSAVTDSAGRFSMTGILTGKYILSVVKQDFTTYTSPISIGPDDTVHVRAEMTSVLYTTKLSGIVSDQDGLPVENAEIMVLNPDGTESKLKAITNSAGLYRLWYIPFGLRTIILRKSASEDFSYVEIKKGIDFKEIESQLNLVLEKVSLRGQFTDIRDNHVYRFKTMFNLTWMTENLAYLPAVSPSKSGSDNQPFYYVYGYQGTDPSEAKALDVYQKQGVLYNFTSAKKACPSGWHLADGNEWYVLIKSLGTEAGRKMKSTSGWNSYGNGDNTSGFSALPSGRVNDNGVFVDNGSSAFFWSSKEDPSFKFYYGLYYNDSDASTLGGSGKMALSVRCVRDR